MQTILIIDASNAQLPAYKKARQKGLRIIGLDSDPENPGLDYCDDFIIADTSDLEDVRCRVLDYATMWKLDGIFTLMPGMAHTASILAHQLGLPCLTPEAAQTIENKVNLKASLQTHNIASSDFRAIFSYNDLEHHIQHIGMPAILRPSHHQGADNYLYISKDTDLFSSYHHMSEYTRDPILLLESYIAGHRLSVDGIIEDGRFTALAHRDIYRHPMTPSVSNSMADSGVMPSILSKTMLHLVTKTIQTAIGHLSLNHGYLHIDLVINSDQIYILDISQDCSDNQIISHHIPVAYGLDFMDILIDMALGKKVHLNAHKTAPSTYIGGKHIFDPHHAHETTKDHYALDHQDYLALLKERSVLKTSGKSRLPNYSAMHTLVTLCDSHDHARQKIEQASLNLITQPTNRLQ